jgi:hypothetical protein
MVPNNLCKHNARTLLVANVSTERLDVLPERSSRETLYTLHNHALLFRKKQQNLTAFAATTFGNVKLKPSHFHVFTFPVKIRQLLKTNKCTTMYCVYSKTRIKTLKKLLHVSIFRSSSGSTCSSLLKLC